MNQKTIFVKSPANIALIKYMGKKDFSLNLPVNPSASLTLDALSTVAEVHWKDDGKSGCTWKAETPRYEFRADLSYQVPKLDRSGAERVTKHMTRVRRVLPGLLEGTDFEVAETGSLICRTANTFPTAAGIASSASSFSAITLATVLALIKNGKQFLAHWKSEPKLRQILTDLSRQGSGSSCRSFGGPWVIWNEDQVQELSCAVQKWAVFVLVVNQNEKKVPSSEAHFRVLSSPLWNGRQDRVLKKIETFKSSLEAGDIKTLAKLAWSEAWEMHSLFHTSEDPFSYWESDTLNVLRWIQPKLQMANPPLVTLDAGPNVHIIVPEKTRSYWKKELLKQFSHLQILEDRAGEGAEVVSSEGNI